MKKRKDYPGLARLGSVIVERLPRPKICRTTFSITKARITTTRPITAAITVFLAASTAALSPPEIIHFTPPRIRKIREAIIPRMINPLITNLTTFSIVTGPGLKFEFGSRLICAAAGRAERRERYAAVEKVINFFIYK